MTYCQHSLITSGTLNVVNALQSLRTLVRRQAETYKSDQYPGGNATVALFLSDTIPLTGDDWNRAMQHAIWLRNFAPGMFYNQAVGLAEQAAFILNKL